MARQGDQQYIDFASKVSFFEFGKEGFRPPDLDLGAVDPEIQLLESRKNWNIDSLSNFIDEHPRSFKVFEAIFQLARFTDAQMIHFVFEVSELNKPDITSLYEYAILNLKHDEHCRAVFLKKLSRQVGEKSVSFKDVVEQPERFEQSLVVATFKMAVSTYVKDALDDFAILEHRITKREFASFSIRVARYLLETLELNRFLEGVRVRNFLRAKQIPVDTKGLHGTFLKRTVVVSLERNGFVNVDEQLKAHGMDTIPIQPEGLGFLPHSRSERYFCTEKYVEGIVKPNDGGPKKFDVILLTALKPKHVFELNFYTTAGTKIGINEEEYVALKESINPKTGVHFHWVTDGNYWLSQDGQKRFARLLPHFETIYNANTFVEHLRDFE